MRYKIFIDSSTLTDQIFMLLDTAQSDNEDEIKELMNDSATEFIAPEKIEVTDNPDNASVLTPDAHVHVVDEGTTHTKELEINEKRKRPEENTFIIWKCNVSPHSQENCLLDGGVYH